MALAISLKNGESFTVGTKVFTVVRKLGDTQSELSHEGKNFMVNSIDWAEPSPEIFLSLSDRTKPGWTRVMIDAPTLTVTRNSNKEVSNET